MWAAWRLAYHGSDLGGDGQPHAAVPQGDGQSIFEAIEQSGLPDEVTYIVWRGESTFALLNVFPYTSGHVMVLPRRATPTLADLDEATFDELWRGVRAARSALAVAYQPEGINVGLNEGAASGASEPEHLHVHVVPRWAADTNFMTTVFETRVVPEALVDTWRRLRDAWPESLGFPQ